MNFKDRLKERLETSEVLTEGVGLMIGLGSAAFLLALGAWANYDKKQRDKVKVLKYDAEFILKYKKEMDQLVSSALKNHIITFELKATYDKYMEMLVPVFKQINELDEKEDQSALRKFIKDKNLRTALDDVKEIVDDIQRTMRNAKAEIKQKIK
jgi:hypothetical protein